MSVWKVAKEENVKEKISTSSTEGFVNSSQE